MGQFGVVPHALFEQAGQGREHERAVHAQLVHQLEPGPRLPEGRNAAHRLPDQLPVRLALGIAPAEVLLLRAGAGNHLEGRVGDVLAHRAPDHDLRAPVELDVVDGALVAIRQVPGEGVLGLVEVVVGVKDRKIADSRHGLTVIAFDCDVNIIVLLAGRTPGQPRTCQVFSGRPRPVFSARWPTMVWVFDCDVDVNTWLRLSRVPGNDAAAS
jgi:hypothetical protein